MFFAVKAQSIPTVQINSKSPSCSASKNAFFSIVVYNGTATSLVIQSSTAAIKNNEFDSTLTKTTLLRNDTIHFVVSGTTPNFTIDSFVIITPAAALTAFFQMLPASCAGSLTGSADVIAQGGTPPYTYLWSNGKKTAGITGDAAGIYTVTITDDHGCVDNANTTVTIGSDQPIAANIIGTSPLCNDSSNGSLVLNVSGGSGNFIYEWSNNKNTQNISGLKAGKYSVTIKDRTDTINCKITDSVTLKQPLPLSVSIVQSAGETGTNVLAYVSGGTPSYTYKWSSGQTTPAISNMPASVDTLSAKDINNCMLADTIVNIIYISQGSPIVENSSGVGSNFPIYSAFTPNGDGINEVWNIPNFAPDSVVYKNCTVKVYDQWSNLVFQSVGYSKPWDGTDTNGKKVPVSTYYYVINTQPGTDNNKTYTGSVMIFY